MYPFPLTSKGGNGDPYKFLKTWRLDLTTHSLETATSKLNLIISRRPLVKNRLTPKLTSIQLKRPCPTIWSLLYNQILWHF